MRILLDPHSIDRTEHAQKVLRKIAVRETDPEYPYNAKPIGVPHHLARFPKLCDECGLTYWSQDEYGFHLGCRGLARKTGF